MAAPPEEKESTTISMVVEKWSPGQVEQISPVHRIKGYPWRLRLYEDYEPGARTLSLICDKAIESELWECTAKANLTIVPAPIPGLNKKVEKRRRIVKSVDCSFNSWDDDIEKTLIFTRLEKGVTLEVNIETAEDGESWRVRPFFSHATPHDGTLLIGGEKIHVNKESLAAQSPYFDRLFFGNFKEKNMAEIPIGDVEYEEFYNMLLILYGYSVYLDDDNVHRVLELADRFELKIVEDRAVSYILYYDMPQILKLQIAFDWNIAFLKDKCMKTYATVAQMDILQSRPEYADFSDSAKAEIDARMMELSELEDDSSASPVWYR